MRRIVPLVLVFSLVTVLGCGGGDSGSVGSGARSAATTADTPSTVQAQAAPKPANPRLILATTTSTVDSGLLDELLPVFERQTGYKVVPLSLGSGQALATAERGEADVLLVHSPDAEKGFMDAGHGLDRRLVMHNDFVVVGPEKDPAGVRSAKTAAEALRRIAAARTTFISRGDNSGTHALEQKLWKGTGIDPKGQGWYVESGTGMGQTLQISSERQGYTLSDRATFLAQRKVLQLTVLTERDPALLNVYHVIRVNPSKNDRINAEGARAFAEFMVSPETQRLIAEFGKAKVGEPLFVPDAGKDEASLGL
jgi:tungstate transport system substrate-binding protein